MKERIAPFKFIATNDRPNDVVNRCRNVWMWIVIFSVIFLKRNNIKSIRYTVSLGHQDLRQFDEGIRPPHIEFSAPLIVSRTHTCEIRESERCGAPSTMARH